jgi:hypothetical protein
MVSDGLNSLNVMMSSNIADLADNGAIQEGTIVRVNEFMHNEAGGKRLVENTALSMILNVSICCHISHLLRLLSMYEHWHECAFHAGS